VRLTSPPPPTTTPKKKLSYDPTLHCAYHFHKYGRIYEHKEATCKIRDTADSRVLICAATFAPEPTASSLCKSVPLISTFPESASSAPNTSHLPMEPQEIDVTRSGSVTATPVLQDSGRNDLASHGIDLHKETRARNSVS
jgi:hypothetical protein